MSEKLIFALYFKQSRSTAAAFRFEKWGNREMCNVRSPMLKSPPDIPQCGTVYDLPLPKFILRNSWKYANEFMYPYQRRIYDTFMMQILVLSKNLRFTWKITTYKWTKFTTCHDDVLIYTERFLNYFNISYVIASIRLVKLTILWGTERRYT